MRSMGSVPNDLLLSNPRPCRYGAIELSRPWWVAPPPRRFHKRGCEWCRLNRPIPYTVTSREAL